MVSSTEHRESRSLREALDGAAGYSTELHLRPEELARLKALIEKQWLEVVRSAAPELVETFAGGGIERYHEHSHLVDHASLWPKRCRILPAEAVAEIRAMSLFDRLEDHFGEFVISNEDELEPEELYWRIVRPRQSGDIGPLHADAWFWELGHGATPADMTRVKVWIAVVTEPGRSGLRIVPGSHLREWRYHGEMRHGFVKPQIDEDERELNPQLVPMSPGDAIVFHDRLLHGGAMNEGELTRVSLEFTMFVKSWRPAGGEQRP